MPSPLTTEDMMIEVAWYEDNDDVLIVHRGDAPRGEMYSNARCLRSTREQLRDFIERVKAGDYDAF